MRIADLAVWYINISEDDDASWEITNNRGVDGIALQRSCILIHSNDYAGRSCEWSRVNHALKRTPTPRWGPHLHPGYSEQPRLSDAQNINVVVGNVINDKIYLVTDGSRIE